MPVVSPMFANVIPARFIPLEIAAKLLVSLGIGLLVGFEREWSRKDLGVARLPWSACWA